MEYISSISVLICTGGLDSSCIVQSLATYVSYLWWTQKVPPVPAAGCERWSGIGCWEWGHRSTVWKPRPPDSPPAFDHLEDKKRHTISSRLHFRKAATNQNKLKLNFNLLKLNFNCEVKWQCTGWEGKSDRGGSNAACTKTKKQQNKPQNSIKFFQM